MYTPVATRFRTYAVELDEVSQAYVDAVLLRPTSSSGTRPRSRSRG